MFYEEKIEAGKLYFRTIPTGKWIAIDYAKLLDRLIDAENKIYELQNFVRQQQDELNALGG